MTQSWNLQTLPELKKLWLALLACILLAFAFHWPSLKNGYVWDDDRYVTQNIELRSLDGLKNIWFKFDSEPQYYPLTHTFFWVEYQLWGLNPVGYHFDNIFIHGVNAFLVGLILLSLGIPGAWLVAAIFAIHPVHVESVAWITERKNVLSGLFYLLSFFSYLKFIEFSRSEQVKPAAGHFNYKWIVYAISLLLFICALLSKTIAASLPAAVLLVIWYKNGHITRRDIFASIPFFIFGIVFGIVTAQLEMNQVGAMGMDWSLTFLQRCGVAGRALWFYAVKLLWPEPLIFIYPRWSPDQISGWYLLFPASFIAVLAALYFGRKLFGRGPLVALLFFAGTLFPALGFFNVYPHKFSYVADHFQYLASIGIISLFSALLAIWFGKMKSTRLKTICTSIVVIFLLLNLGMKTTIQSRAYYNATTLWQDTIKKNTSAWIAYNNLGNYYLLENKYDQAIESYTKALNLKPNFEYAHFNLASVYRRMGAFNKALEHYDKTVQLFAQGRSLNPSSRPGILPEAHNSMGYIYTSMGRFDQAYAQLNLAVGLRPDYAEAYNNLGNAYLKQSRLKEAVDAFGKALTLKPNNAQYHNNIGAAYANMNDMNRAVYHFRKALEIKPDYNNAKRNLAMAIDYLKENDSGASGKNN